MLRGIILGGIALLINSLAAAQSYTETALLFSRISPGGSARILALGGAQASLGGDYSSAFSNPAGLGMFNRSEFTASLGQQNNRYESSYLGNTSSNARSNFHIPGLSLVMHNPQGGRKGLLGGSWGITFNRINNFNQTFSYAGRNRSNSIIDFFIEDATGLLPNQLTPNGSYFNTPTGLAYNNYLIEDSTFINPNASNRDYASVLGVFRDNPNDIRSVDQAEEVRYSGAQNQWSISYGANFSDRFFLGATLGITTIRFRSQKTYSERNFFFELDQQFNPLDNLQLQEDLTVNGTGVNLGIGAIARPLDMVQLGVSYVTPTVYNLTDTYTASLSTLWNNFDYFGDGSTILRNVSERTNDLITEYYFNVPSRLTLSATVFAGRFGFVTGDVELTNYGRGRFSSQFNDISFDTENRDVRQLYSAVANYRMGAEFRYEKFRLRAGYAYQPDPFRVQQNQIDRGLQRISGGIGYRDTKFYLDIAVIRTTGAAGYRPYVVNSADSPLVRQQNQILNVVVTAGFPF